MAAVDDPDWLAYRWFDPYRALIRTLGWPAPPVPPPPVPPPSVPPPSPQTGAATWLQGLNVESRRRGLVNANGQPIRFVAAAAMPAVTYETVIAETGEVPTRLLGDDAWHDYFNAVVWLSFPATKARLNALQVRTIDDSSGAGRGRLRDMLTLFDESAAIVTSTSGLPVDALRSHNWQALFVDQRAGWGREIDALVFGHALLMKLCRPYKSVCAQAWVMPVEPMLANPPVCGMRQVNDARLADTLTVSSLAPGCLSPLPVLGVPGWWPANEDATFYRDVEVFRPKRQRRPTGD